MLTPFQPHVNPSLTSFQAVTIVSKLHEKLKDERESANEVREADSRRSNADSRHSNADSRHSNADQRQLLEEHTMLRQLQDRTREELEVALTEAEKLEMLNEETMSRYAVSALVCRGCF